MAAEEQFEDGTGKISAAIFTSKYKRTGKYGYLRNRSDNCCWIVVMIILEIELKPCCMPQPVVS